MNMKSEEFIEANRKNGLDKNKKKKDQKCPNCQNLIDDKKFDIMNKDIGSGRIPIESSTRKKFQNERKDSRTSRSEVKIEDGNISSRKFTLSYQNKKEDASEVTSTSSIPIKYEDQLRQYE